jgi:hypothetical protein
MSGPSKLRNATQSPPTTGDCRAPLPFPARHETRNSGNPRILTINGGSSSIKFAFAREDAVEADWAVVDPVLVKHHRVSFPSAIPGARNRLMRSFLQTAVGTISARKELPDEKYAALFLVRHCYCRQA